LSDAPGQTGPAPEISFTTFVLSLSTAALENLGVRMSEEEDPCTNLALAKQTIDVLDMLAHKTTGNLSEEEGKLLSAVLYDLRIRYVESARAAGCPEPTTK
jgi:hypothetical protein